MTISAGLAAFKLTYQLSPIILTGGIAQNIPGGMLPIILLTQGIDFVAGLLGAGVTDLNLDGFFANFVPVPGSSLIDQKIGKYPFANQAVAANAVIRDPLRISMRMICPAAGASGYLLKLATITALQAALASHNASGGTYTIATPSYFYTNCVMLQMVDTSNNASAQAQNTYQLDFEQPLLTLQAAQAAQNSLLSAITAGTPLNGAPAWSGLSTQVGSPPSLGVVGTVPAASGPAASSIAAPTAPQIGGPQ